MIEIAATTAAWPATVPQPADSTVRRKKPEEAAAWAQAKQDKKKIESPSLPRLKRNLPAVQERFTTMDEQKRELLADIETYNDNQDKKLEQKQGRTELAGAAVCLDGHYGKVKDVLDKLDSGQSVEDLKRQVAASRAQLEKAKNSLR